MLTKLRVFSHWPAANKRCIYLGDAQYKLNFAQFDSKLHSNPDGRTQLQSRKVHAAIR
jgi:hypothetical protein